MSLCGICLVILIILFHIRKLEARLEDTEQKIARITNILDKLTNGW